VVTLSTPHLPFPHSPDEPTLSRCGLHRNLALFPAGLSLLLPGLLLLLLLEFENQFGFQKRKCDRLWGDRQ
jgi:hypothetical protein